MDIKKYLYTLVKQRREGDTSPELARRIAYVRAYMHGEETLSRLRDRWIEAEIAKRYTSGAESRIAFNYIKAPTDAKNFAEFEAHEVYVLKCKSNVDAEMARYKSEVAL